MALSESSSGEEGEVEGGWIRIGREKKKMKMKHRRREINCE